ncbi:hypothetical protein D9Q98_003899 [Chlorella vulgaris]|uniref:Uncharacterized protein n=1 Tax=Chlorella vulgaris TaxID=3077 RepID=A0A9D4YY14_CHLVU|nr:hypothetical protein D9Q98_003899 [Chlorella vulgaris]
MGDPSTSTSAAAQHPSPYVHGAHNVTYGYGKRNGNNSGRFRPETKAQIIVGWQNLDMAARSFSDTAQAAPGPPQSRRMGRGQLDRETTSETTTCKGAISCLQQVFETQTLEAGNQGLGDVVAELEAEGSPESLRLAERLRRCLFVGKRYAGEAFDLYFSEQAEDGTCNYWGLALQYRVPRLKQHWKLGQKERSVFKVQRAVTLHGQVAALFTGYRFYCASAGELPPPGSLSPQPDSEEAEELEMAVEEDEELAAGEEDEELEMAVEEDEERAAGEGAEQQGGGAQAEPGDAEHGHYFDALAAGLQGADNMKEFVCLLAEKVLVIPPLPDMSASTGVLHPHCFLGQHQSQYAKLQHAAFQWLARSLPEGWQDIQLAQLKHLLQLASNAVGGTVAAALALLQGEEAGATTLGEAVLLLGEAADDALRQQKQQEQQKQQQQQQVEQQQVEHLDGQAEQPQQEQQQQPQQQVEHGEHELVVEEGPSEGCQRGAGRRGTLPASKDAPAMLFHAAALVGTAALAGQRVEPSVFAAASVEPGAAAQQRIRSLHVSSTDACAAARVGPELHRLVYCSFPAAAHATGIDLAAGGTGYRLSAEERTFGQPDNTHEGEEADGAAESIGTSGWLAALLSSCSSSEDASQLKAAVTSASLSGLVDLTSLRGALMHFRQRLEKAGVQLASTANNGGPASRRRLGGGDEEHGAALQAALTTWEKCLRSIGAGPIAGLKGSPGAGAVLDEWRLKVETGWPEAKPCFETALQEGLTLSQLQNRWSSGGSKGLGPWVGTNPDPSLQLKTKRGPAKGQGGRPPKHKKKSFHSKF